MIEASLKSEVPPLCVASCCENIHTGQGDAPYGDVLYLLIRRQAKLVAPMRQHELFNEAVIEIFSGKNLYMMSVLKT
jgi:hypothetical protein